MTLMAEGHVKVETFSVKFRDLYPRLDELKRSVAPWLRGSFLGFLVGLVPGPAATIASFVSYGVERRFSKHKEEFGTGAIEGVAGPEAANNAAAGGAMIPLLSLGLPFTPATAILLGGMLLQGVTPGPMLLKDNPEIFWGVIGSFYLGNVMLLVLNLPLVGVFASIVRIAPKYLMPVSWCCASWGPTGTMATFLTSGSWPRPAWWAILCARPTTTPPRCWSGWSWARSWSGRCRQALIISQGDVAGLWDSPVSVVMLGGALVCRRGAAWRWPCAGRRTAAVKSASSGIGVSGAGESTVRQALLRVRRKAAPADAATSALRAAMPLVGHSNRVAADTPTGAETASSGALVARVAIDTDVQAIILEARVGEAGPLCRLPSLAAQLTSVDSMEVRHATRFG